MHAAAVAVQRTQRLPNVPGLAAKFNTIKRNVDREIKWKPDGFLGSGTKLRVVGSVLQRIAGEE